jgi:hypothetical protein
MCVDMTVPYRHSYHVSPVEAGILSNHYQLCSETLGSKSVPLVMSTLMLMLMPASREV